MATLTFIRESYQSIPAMQRVMNYCMQEKKTVEEGSRLRFVSGVHCVGASSVEEFLATKAAHGKPEGAQFYQYVQSFSPRENISHAQAHRIALEFAEKAWPGHEVLVCTHCDTRHPHSHFVINSVSYESGLKLRQNPNTLKQLRKLSDEICAAHGFSTLKTYQGGRTGVSAREYRTNKRGGSWKYKLMFEINRAMEKSTDQEDFIRNMNRSGYGVTWTQERKEITFLCPNGKKCRGSKLNHDRYKKEKLERELLWRKKYAEAKVSGTAVPGVPSENTDWEKERKTFLRSMQSIHPVSQSYGNLTLPKFIQMGYSAAAVFSSLSGSLSDDPEERQRQIDAIRTGGNIGAILGLTGMAVMLLVLNGKPVDEDDEEDYNEFLAEEAAEEEEMGWGMSM